MPVIGGERRWRVRWPAFSSGVCRGVPVSARRVVTLTLVFGGAFSLLLGLVFGAYHQAEVRQHRVSTDGVWVRLLDQTARALREDLSAALSDLAHLQQDGDLTRLLHDGDGEAAARLGEKYLALVRQTRRYERVRVIDAYGWERVGVHRVAGRPTLVSADELRNRRDRHYFSQTVRLPRGQAYVSPVEPDPDAHPTSEPPAAPVIHLAAPVHDRGGLAQGVLVLSYRGERLLDRVQRMAPVPGAVGLLGDDGAWLMGPQAGAERAGQSLGHAGQGLASAYPEAWAQITGTAEGTVETPDARVQFRRVYPLRAQGSVDPEAPPLVPVAAADYVWTVVAIRPLAEEYVPGEAAEHALAIAYAVLASFSFVVAAALALGYVRSRGLARALEQIVDNLPELVAYVDAGQRYRFNNRAFARLLGVTPESLCGRSVREVLGEGAYRRLGPCLEQALRGQPVAFDAWLDFGRAGGYEMSVTCVPDVAESGEVNGVYVVARDMTQLRASERRDRQRMLELAHVSRLASMGAMATEIAHEVNQPLAAIAMYSAASLRTLAKGGDTSAVTGWLTAIDAQAKRVGEVVQRLRQFLQKGDDERGPTDLNEVVREVAGLVGIEARSQGIDLLLDLTSELPPVLADRVLLEQVVLNLVRNALDAVSQQGGARRVLVATRRAGENVEVAVADNGPGVPLELGRSIFDSFVSSRPDGLGMGLAISRSIIEAHEGEIGYANNPEGGTTFRFTLPSVSP